MTTAEKIYRNLQSLPAEKVEEVADFVDFLLSKQSNPPVAMIGHWPKEFVENILGQWQGEPLERPHQGDFEKRLEL
jgi:hypothetical protein